MSGPGTIREGPEAGHRIGVLISGRGSNLAAILAASAAGTIPAPVGLVISNRPDAPGLEHARRRSVPWVVLDDRETATREEHDHRMATHLRQEGADLVCLAGYMRLLSPWFLGEYRHRVLNIHPSLLPAFPGLHAQRQALRHGVKISGCTVHLVDEGLDTGPIILQRAVPIVEGDDEEALSARILKVEHELYPEAIRLFCEDRIDLQGRTVRIRPS